MSAQNSTWDSLFAAQLEGVFSSCLVLSFLYHQDGLSLPFDGVADSYPARLSGVLPGDVRVRARADDLASLNSPGSPDYITAVVGGAVLDVISTIVEFGGAGLCLQVRRVLAHGQSGAAPVGLSIPCLTRNGRDAITSPAAGTAIFQTDNTPGLRVFNGSNWMRFTETGD